jgi:hypothetical protein
MGIVFEEAQPLARDPVSLGAGEPDPVKEPSLLATATAAIRQFNVPVSLIRSLHLPPAGDDNYNPMEDIKGSKYFERYAGNFLGARSRDETQQIMARIDAEERDQQILAASGNAGVVASIGAGLLDPTIFLPAGAVYRSARGGHDILRTARSFMLGGASQAILSEAALQSSHETFGFSDAAFSVGAAALLGGLLGGAVAKLSRAEVQAMSAAFEREREILGEHLAGPVRVDSPAVVPGRDAEIQAPLERSVGAAEADTRSLDVASYGLDKVPIVRDVVRRLFPDLRVYTSKGVSARRAMADLAETALLFDENRAGRTTTMQGGPALNREVIMFTDGLRTRFNDELTRLWSEVRYGNAEQSFPHMREIVGNLSGKPKGLTFDQFKASVFDALNNGDKHQTPQVQAAAQWLRKNLFEVMGPRAEKSIPEFKAFQPRDGESYAPHMPDKDKIAANRPEAVEDITRWYDQQQTVKREAQERMTFANAQLRSWNDQIKRLEGRLETVAGKIDELDARQAERGMEVRRTEQRAEALNERSALLSAEIEDIESFIREMSEEVRDPSLKARIEELKAEAAALRKADRPMTEAELKKIEQQELSAILDPETRQLAEYVTGRRSPPKARSFLRWIAKKGGINMNSPEGSWFKTVLEGKGVGVMRDGADARQSSFLPQSQRSSLDDLAQKIHEFSDGLIPEPPSYDEIFEWVRQSASGREPDWWVRASGGEEYQNAAYLYDVAQAWDRVLNEAGTPVKSVRDFAKILRDGDGRFGKDVTLDDLDRIAADMENAGASVPGSVQRQAADDALLIPVTAVRRMREMIAEARTAKDSAAARLRRTDIQTGEAESNALANRGRLGVLEQRMTLAERKRELVIDALEFATRERDGVRLKLEEEIGKWEGKSAQEAKTAIKAREKYAAESNRAPDAKRLTSADDAVDRVVKRIIASDRNIPVEELRARAEETLDRWIGGPDGRLPYEVSVGYSERSPVGANELRGSLAERDFQLPFDVKKKWLVDDVEQVVSGYLRSVVPDVLLAERFGDIRMTEVFRKHNEEYAALIQGAKGQKERMELHKERDRVSTNLAGVRDRIRNVYGFSADTQLRNAARIAASAKRLNNLISGGMMAVSSLPDMAGVVFRHGLGSAFSDGWEPFFRAMTDANTWEAAKKAGKEWRAVGIAVETSVASRQRSIDDITEMYRSQSRIERGLEAVTDKFFVANLLAPFTDLQKSVAANVAAANILRAAEAVTKGKATAKQVRLLGESNIDTKLASKIWGEFEKGGEVIDGVYVPNTADWTAPDARRAFQGAVARDVDIAVVTPGQEKPFWMSNPVWGVLGQFKTFMASSTQRIMIANLQRHDAAALQGLVFSVGLGMLAYRIHTFAAGTPVSDRPQDWVKEGLSRSGVMGWLEEGNAIASKGTRGAVDIYRLIGADKPLSRYANRNAADLVLGPTWGKVQNLLRVTGAAGAGEWTEGDTHALRLLFATQNLLYTRMLFDQAEKGINSAFGIPMKAQ